MKSVLIIVGTELLNGCMVDTNSVYMAEELNKYGIEIAYKIVVRDNIEEISEAIRIAKEKVDLVVLSGGLGPTLDDVTKDGIAKYLNREMIIDEEELETLKGKFKKHNLDFKNSNFKEVQKPKGAISFINDRGMAPAIYVEGIAAFPGVPVELKNMFPKFLEFFSKEKELKNKVYIKDILTFGIPESILEDKIKDLFIEKDIQYEFLVKQYATLIRLQTIDDKANKVEKIIKKIYNRIEFNIFGEDKDRLENLLYNLLVKDNLTISVAESCTGGLISSKLVSIPGISKVFKEGIICYGNSSKIERLGVKEETLKKYGAVSKEVAYEMLNGLDTDIAISTTGIAGPDGGTEEKPVGLVYIGIKIKNEIYIDEKRFFGTRERIRERASSQAFFNLIKKLS